MPWRGWAYLVMVTETLGDDWLTPDLFPFGASNLVNDVLMQIVKTIDRNYQSSGLLLAALTRLTPAASFSLFPVLQLERKMVRRDRHSFR